MKIGIVGASGRMGQAVLKQAEQQQLQVSKLIVSDSSSKRGEQASNGVNYEAISDGNGCAADVLIDFSLPSALDQNLAYAVANKVPMVVCVTGLNDDQKAALEKASKMIPVLYAANTSVGVHLLQALSFLSARVLADADVEILEAHHSAKRDAPSGTAILLAEQVATARQQDLSHVSQIRQDGLREAGSIGFAVLRAADIVGEHTVLLAQPGERVELTHRVTDRAIFAQGALKAASWLVQKPVGRYNMGDALELKAHLGALMEQI